MSKKTIVNEIIDLFDENAELKATLKNLTGNVQAPQTGEEKIDALAEIKKVVFLKGLRALLSSYSVPSVFNNLDDVFNETSREFIPFESWFGRVEIEGDSYAYRQLDKTIRSNLSLKETKELFKPLLEEVYIKNVNEKKGEIMREGKEAKE